MSFLSPTTRPRLNEAVGLMLLGLALLLVLSLFSYHPMDPSLNVSRHPVSQDSVHNFIGEFGSILSDLLLTAFGYASFLFPVMFSIFGWKWLRSHNINTPAVKIFGLLCLAASGCLLLALAFPYPVTVGWSIQAGEIAGTGGAAKAGGLIGDLLAEWFQGRFNWTGACIVGFMIFMASLFVATRFSFRVCLDWLERRLQFIKVWQARWRNWRKAEEKKRQKRRLEARLKRGEERKAATAQKTSEIKEWGPAAEEPSAPTLISGEEESGETAPAAGNRKAKRTARGSQTDFLMPSIDLLQAPGRRADIQEDELLERAGQLTEKCKEFGVHGQVQKIHPGPVVTTYEFKPEAGVKYSRITNLVDDLCLALKAESVRINRLPGKSTVGVEVPNADREQILLSEVIRSDEFQQSASRLTIALGKDIVGKIVIADLAKMPHLLIAGQTGAGKSVGLNAMILSILYKSSPEEVKFIMVDPKRLELGLYEDIPHLMTPVVVEPKRASNALKWATKEMENRYKLLATVGVRSIDQFNTFVRKPRNLELFSEEQNAALKPLPFIVIVIDELADLMMVASKDIEDSIMRLAQMARAVGIHLIVATQRPSVDVLTGIIKANFPSRISFRVAQKVDSRTILDQMGAQQLLGKGDMLFIPPGTSRMTRVHGALVTTEEINGVVEHLKSQAQPVYDQGVVVNRTEKADTKDPERGTDELYDEAVRIVVEMGKASTSTLQRRLRIGYGRAARLLDIMEEDGIVGPPDGSKPREVLKRPDYFREMDESRVE